MANKAKLLSTVPPQIHSGQSTAKIVYTVILCLVPAGIWAVFAFGFYVVAVIASSVITAIIAEYAMNRLLRSATLMDGTAALTGLLVAYGMPPQVPLYVPIIASLFAIIVVKWTFGGLGSNFMNPALAGRCFASFCFSSQMVGNTMPLTIVKERMAEGLGGFTGPMDILSQANTLNGAFDTQATDWVNATILNPIGIDLPRGYVDLFLGNSNGYIGEVSIVLLLLGTIVLIAQDIIVWELPVVFLGTLGVFSWIFGGIPYGNGYFSGDILFQLWTGSAIIGAFFMATDPVTSPMTKKGMIFYAIGAGLLAFAIRSFGAYPEGVAFAILIMNCVVPLINRACAPKPLGYSRRRKK